MEDRICPICDQPLQGMFCSRCGLDLTVFNRFTISARQLISQVLEEMQAKSYLKALKLLEQGLQFNPKDSELLLLAGLCHYSLGDLAQADYCWCESKNAAAAEYRQKITDDQASFQWIFNRYHRALDLRRAGKPRQALRTLARSLKTGPQYLPALELLAQTCYELRKYWQCRRILKRIKEITVDSPLLVQFATNLDRKVIRWCSVYLSTLLLLIVVCCGYGLKQVIAMGKPSKVQIVYRNQVIPNDRFDREALRATARSLAARNDPLTGADILAAISNRAVANLGFNAEEELMLERAAVHYYYEGRHHFCKGNYDAAAVSFSKCRSYPVSSYVFDDTLYYQAIVKERLGAIAPAVALYQQLLTEVPDSNYCSSAVVRWGELAKQHRELRTQYLAIAQTHPQFCRLVTSLARRWEESR